MSGRLVSSPPTRLTTDGIPDSRPTAVATMPGDRPIPCKSSGRPDLDQSAIQALTLTENLQPLYDDFTKPYIVASVSFEFEKKNE